MEGQTNRRANTNVSEEADKSELPKGIPQECLRVLGSDLSPPSHRHKGARTTGPQLLIHIHIHTSAQMETLSSSSFGIVLEQETPQTRRP